MKHYIRELRYGLSFSPSYTDKLLSQVFIWEELDGLDIQLSQNVFSPGLVNFNDIESLSFSCSSAVLSFLVA